MNTCKDCATEGVTTQRVIATDRNGKPYPGPRCVTHYRARKRELSGKAHSRRVETTYGITQAEYEAIYLAQGGKCAICQVATGKRKRLAVDHDHDCTQGHPPNIGCSKCIRGLLCSRCNYTLLGKYNEASLRRALTYLNYPPAQTVLLGMDEK